MAVKVNDIYIKVDKQIVEQGFWESNKQEKKKLVEEGLISYTMSKLSDFGIDKEKISDKDIIDLSNLLIYLDKNIKDINDKKEIFTHYSHYLLKIASCIQGFTVIWYQEDDENLIDNPHISFDEYGMWDCVKTHKNTSLLRTTLFIFDVFKNEFSKDKNIQKQKIISRSYK